MIRYYNNNKPIIIVIFCKTVRDIISYNGKFRFDSTIHNDNLENVNL